MPASHPYHPQVPLPRPLYDALKALAAAQEVTLRTLVPALLAHALQAPPDLRAWPVAGTAVSGRYQAPGTTPEAFPVEALPWVSIADRQALPEEPGLLFLLGEAPRAVLYIAHALSLREYQPCFARRVTAWRATRMAWRPSGSGGPPSGRSITGRMEATAMASLRP